MIAFCSKTTRACLAAALVVTAAGAARAVENPGAAAPATTREEVVLGAGSEPAPAPPAAEKKADSKRSAAKADVAATHPGTEARPLIQTVGEADQKIFVVDHGGKWSMHAENVLTTNIVRLWQQAGGPEVTMKVPVDRAYTLSVHAVAPEIIFERLFEGFGYTLHYDDDGKLVSARIYSMAGTNAFKTPRLTETLSDWKKAETEPEAAAAPAE